MKLFLHWVREEWVKYIALTIRDLAAKFAIKILPSHLSADQDRLSRFEQEARAVGVLNHPNILTVFDIGSIDGNP